jgi:hypothetical protein
MTRVERLENDLRQMSMKLDLVSEKLNLEIWMKQNPPMFKYGDTFEGGYRVLSSFPDKCWSEFGYRNEDYTWKYNMDTGTDHRIVKENTLIKLRQL